MRILYFLILFVIPLTGCSDYWWERGQPQGPSKLYQKSLEELSGKLELESQQRSDIAALSKEIKTSFETALSKDELAMPEVIASLSQVRNAFIQLDGKLSIGSRAAYGELSGELRQLLLALSAQKNLDEQTTNAVRLYTARVMFFLANELSMPQPNF